MFFKSTKVIGLDIGTSYIKLAEVDGSKKGASLVSFGIAPTPANSMNGRGEIQDPAAISAVLQNLVKEIKTKRKNVSVGIWGSGVMVKKITGPRLAPKDLQANLRFEAEQYIPFDINEINLDFAILSKNQSAETMDYLLVAAQRKALFQIAEIVETSGLQCSVVDVSGFSLANVFQMTYGVKPGDVSAVLNCGATFTNIVVVDGADVMLCRDVPAAGNLITSEISKAMSVSFEEAEALKISFSTGQNPAQEVQEVVRSAVDDLVSQIQKAFEFYTASSPDSPIQRIFVSGGTSQMSLFKETLKSAVNIPIEKLSPFVNIGYNSRAMSDQYIQQITPYSAVAIGLALRKVDEK
jgi:type IV pilus assembly protein PilM